MQQHPSLAGRSGSCTDDVTVWKVSGDERYHSGPAKIPLDCWRHGRPADSLRRDTTVYRNTSLSQFFANLA